jgi:hypothetical protein
MWPVFAVFAPVFAVFAPVFAVFGADASARGG